MTAKRPKAKPKKAPTRARRPAVRKPPGLRPAVLAEMQEAAERLGNALAPAFAPPPPAPVVCVAPGRWVPENPVPSISDKPVERPADLTCLHAFRPRGPVRVAFVREVIDVGGPSHKRWDGEIGEPSFVVFADGETLAFEHSMFARYTPEIGDAFVLYPDGHTAFLPRAQFNACYGGKPPGFWARLCAWLGSPL